MIRRKRPAASAEEPAETAAGTAAENSAGARKAPARHGKPAPPTLRQRAVAASRLPWSRLAVLVVVGVLVATAIVLVRDASGAGQRTYTAYFTTSQGVYAGDEVRVLGVPVGKIDDITPTDDGARITFSIDGDVDIPAEAKAAIVSPSLVSSRYVQLAPQYSSGPKLADGDVIPIERTAVPVEFDEVKKQLDTLAVDLGPDGVNKNGSLSHFVTTTGKVLDGKGQDINDTIAQLSQTISLLDTGREDIFGTVDNLADFVSVLGTSNAQIREFGGRLDLASQVLADNRQDLRRSLRSLGLAVDEVTSFVRDNRSGIVKTAKNLSPVLLTLADQNEAIEQILHVGPNALENLFKAYHADSNSLLVGLQSATTNNLRQLVCGAIGSVGPGAAVLAQTCSSTLGPLLDALSGDLPLSTELLAAIEEALGLTGIGR